MKFLVTWKLYSDKKMDAFAAFSQMTADDDAADHGPAIKLIGRWHDLVSGTGVAVCEADDASAVSAWIYNWSPVLDGTVTPVLDDAEARAVVAAKLAG